MTVPVIDAGGISTGLKARFWPATTVTITVVGLVPRQAGGQRVGARLHPGDLVRTDRVRRLRRAGDGVGVGARGQRSPPPRPPAGSTRRRPAGTPRRRSARTPTSSRPRWCCRSPRIRCRRFPAASRVTAMVCDCRSARLNVTVYVPGIGSPATVHPPTVPVDWVTVCTLVAPDVTETVTPAAGASPGMRGDRAGQRAGRPGDGQLHAGELLPVGQRRASRSAG